MSTTALKTASSDSSTVRLQRSAGTAEFSFKRRAGQTCIDDLFQSGCAKVRLPKVEPSMPMEAVLLNTAGGLTDGDTYNVSALWRENTNATVSTQTAERIYRARQDDAVISTALSIAPGATAFWLPQETIMFDGGRLDRRTTASIAAGARLLACESVVFGRKAMGEFVNSGAYRDAWELNLDGKPVWRDAFKIDGRITETLDRPAIANGARAMATIIYVGPEASSLPDMIRALELRDDCRAGSTCLGPVCISRILALTGQSMRNVLMTAIFQIQNLILRVAGRLSVDATVGLPRVWTC